jgi:nucleotidyltransferase/DNA polymerase involved in DNA repair
VLLLSKLEREFGRYGVRMYELSRGIDENPVVSDRLTQSISVEDTFQEDVLLAETEPMIRRLAEKLWSVSRQEKRIARTVVLKLKTSEFMQRADRDRPQAARASDSWPPRALSSRRGWSEQFSRSRTDWPSTSALRMTENQSAAAALGGCCFIISSIPFFISLAEGSALWVPTIQL